MSRKKSAICNLKSAIGGMLLLTCIFGVSSCRRDMQDQPKMKPFRGTSFFGDGLSARPPVEGTVPRGFLHTDTALFTGKKNSTAGTTATPVNPDQVTQNGANPFANDVDTFPFPITEEIVLRGQQRYDIFCVVCHGKTGYGDGMVVRRGYRRAASFHDDRLRTAPVGHFFDAITNGWGAMPSYAPQIPVQDRWAIIAYIRALQASQNINPANASASPSPSPTPATAATPGGHR